MKWTLPTLKKKVLAIVTAEKGFRYNTFVFTLPKDSYVYDSSSYYSYYNYDGDDLNAKPPACPEFSKRILSEDAKIYFNNLTQWGISGYVRYAGKRADGEGATKTYGYTIPSYQYLRLDWKDIIAQPKILKALEDWVIKITPHYKATKERGIITFVNTETKEKLHCDLSKQVFTRSYKKGKDKQIRYPAQFFKHVSGRALIQTLTDPKASTFNQLVKLISSEYKQCRNFGTFLVKMFDHQHLEQYISAGVPFDFQIPFNYTDFTKDIRNKLNEHRMRYTQDIGALFCSDFDTGQEVFAQIKDCVGFAYMTRLLARNIQPLNTLVNHYHYDLKRVFEYCRARNWQSGRTNYRYGFRTEKAKTNPEKLVITNQNWVSTYEYDCIQSLRDYARMAIDVYGNNYEKYPANLIAAHNATDAIYKTRQVEIDARKFAESINKDLEWKSKDFVVVYPKAPEEIIVEGQKLRHCVGSYIQSVVRGECQIVFLRQKEEIDKPFVTVEIVGGNISQARAASNTTPTYDARMALRDYAKEKKLLYRG